jgi:hypothetical protein
MYHPKEKMVGMTSERSQRWTNKPKENDDLNFSDCDNERPPPLANE